MKLLFKYDIDKDIQNFLNGLRSVNNPKPTKFHALYIQKHGDDFEASKVKAFIAGYLRENSTNVEKLIEDIKKAWSMIESEFIGRCEKMFGAPYPREEITVYLTTNERCTYSIENGYFFVNMFSASPNKTIMHELLHFYTYATFYRELKAKGLSDHQYNDIKESLTELLNVEFADLMGGSIDKGYPQHANMRKKIKECWNQTKDLKRTIEGI